MIAAFRGLSATTATLERHSVVESGVLIACGIKHVIVTMYDATQACQ